jgi:hypothetical protein
MELESMPGLKPGPHLNQNPKNTGNRIGHHSPQIETHANFTICM